MINKELHAKLEIVSQVLGQDVLRLEPEWYILDNNESYSLSGNFPRLDLEFIALLQYKIQWWVVEAGNFIDVLADGTTKGIYMYAGYGSIQGHWKEPSLDKVVVFNNFLDAFIEIVRANNLIPNTEEELSEEADRETLKQIVEKYGVDKINDMLSELQNTNKAVGDSYHSFEIALDLDSRSDGDITSQLTEVTNAIYDTTGIDAVIKLPKD